MGLAGKAPKNYVRQHAIKSHAIDRFREYGTDVSQASTDRELGDVLDEALCEGLRENTGEPLLDDVGDPCMLIPFTRDYWADPGLFLLVHDDLGKSGYKHVRTVLIKTAVLDMKEKGKLTPKMWTLKKEAPAILGSIAPAVTSAEGLLSEALHKYAPKEERFGPVVPLAPPAEKPKKAVKVAVSEESKDLQEALVVAQQEISKLKYDLEKAAKELKKAPSTKEVAELEEVKRQLKNAQREAADNKAAILEISESRRVLHEECNHAKKELSAAMLDLQSNRNRVKELQELFASHKDTRTTDYLALTARIEQLERTICQMVTTILAYKGAK